jgi:hypothetical protein
VRELRALSAVPLGARDPGRASQGARISKSPTPSVGLSGPKWRLSIPGVEFEEAFSRRVDVQWGDTVVHVISKDDLIRAKRAAGRERDLRDLRALERGSRWP